LKDGVATYCALITKKRRRASSAERNVQSACVFTPTVKLGNTTEKRGAKENDGVRQALS